MPLKEFKMNVHTISLSSTTCTNMESWHINAFMKSYALDTYRKNKHKLEFLSDFPLLDTSFTIFIGLTCICIYHLDAYRTRRCRYTYVDRCKDMSNKHMNTLSGSVPVLRCKPSITPDFLSNLGSIWTSQRKGQRLEGIVWDSGKCFTLILRANKTYSAGMSLKFPYCFLCPSAL